MHLGAASRFLLDGNSRWRQNISVTKYQLLECIENFQMHDFFVVFFCRYHFRQSIVGIPGVNVARKMDSNRFPNSSYTSLTSTASDFLVRNTDIEKIKNTSLGLQKND